jgi:hypothetical protein
MKLPCITRALPHFVTPVEELVCYVAANDREDRFLKRSKWRSEEWWGGRKGTTKNRNLKDTSNVLLPIVALSGHCTCAQSHDMLIKPSRLIQQNAGGENFHYHKTLNAIIIGLNFSCAAQVSPWGMICAVLSLPTFHLYFAPIISGCILL